MMHFLEKCMLVIFCFAASSMYLYYVVRRVHPSFARLLSTLPVLGAFLVLPFVFDLKTEVLARIVTLFISGWLATFKALALSIGRGPLSGPLTLTQFAVLLLLPVFPKQQGAPPGRGGRLGDDAGTQGQLLARAVAKTVLLGGVVYLLLAVQLWRPVKHVVYALGMTGFLGILMDGPASFITSWVGLSIVPTFDRPWLSSSLADFWGRRWNITTSSVLRTLVYDPIVEGTLVKREHPGTKGRDSIASHAKRPRSTSSKRPPWPPGIDRTAREPLPATPTPTNPTNSNIMWRRALGVCATFFVSGAAHECIMRALQPAGAGDAWRWKWLAYFTLQGPLLLLEDWVKAAWCRAKLPPLNIWVSRALALPFLVWLGGLLFFTPVEMDTDLADRVVRACRAGFDTAAGVVVSAVGGGSVPGVGGGGRSLGGTAGL